MSTPVVRDVYVATILRPEGETGVQTHCRMFLGAAREVGWGVRLITPFDMGPAVVYPSFAVGRLAKPFHKGFWVWWYRRLHYTLLRQALVRALASGAPAVVYAQDPLAARAALDARERGLPVEVVLMVHFNESQADEWADHGYITRGGALYRRIAALEQEVLPRVDRLIFPSRFMMRRVMERIEGVASVPRWCIPNFVPAGTRDEAARDVPAGDLISVGTLDVRKNHAFLLEVLAVCHRLGRRYRLTIVGEGPLRSRLRALAEELGVAGHVALPGYVRDAASLMPRHRAYVHAATMENCPIALLEAMAAGCPVFAPPVGGIPEVLADGVEGRFWSLDDPEGAAAALIEVLEAPARLEAAAAAARRRYEREFTPESVAPRLLRTVVGLEPVTARSAEAA